MSVSSRPPRTRAPDVTVVIPCFNMARFVERAIESALDQTGVDVEVIAVDDGSTDDSLARIKRYGETIRCLRGPNGGVCVARNKGLALARSPYVLFLDADDYFEDGHLQALVGEMCGSNYDLILGRMLIMSTKGKTRDQTPSRIAGANPVVAYLSDNHFIAQCSILWSTGFLRELGGWNEAIRRREDIEMVFRAIAAGAHPALTPQGAGVYFQHDSPHRLGGQRDPDALACEIDVFEKIDAHFQAARCDVPAWAAHRAGWAYKIYKRAALAQDRVNARRAAEVWRRVGGRIHEGTFWHRLACQLLGLPLKERLSMRLQKLRSFRVSR